MMATMSAVTTIHVRALRVIGDRTLTAHDATRDCATAGDGIGVLPQFAVLQIQRPDVEDVAVARDVRVDWLVGIGRR